MELTGMFEVVEVKKKTAAIFFKDLKAGDVFELAYTLNGSHHSSPAIDIRQDGVEVHENTANQLRNNLQNFTVKALEKAPV